MASFCGVSNVLLLSLISLATSRQIRVGVTSDGISYGWIDGLCYLDIHATLGDELVFETPGGHNLLKLRGEKESTPYFDPLPGDAMCNSDLLAKAESLAQPGNFPYTYTITLTDVNVGYLGFICSVGSHCNDGQRLNVVVHEKEPDASLNPPEPVIPFMDSESCQASIETFEMAEDPWKSQPSMCDDVITLDDGRKSRICYSPPVTLFPGGIANELRTMFYPYPTDQRVAISDRVFSFVEFDSNGDGTPRFVPLRELYIHHLSGNIVFGQGSEGVGIVTPELPKPYKIITGLELDWMIFHIIDLRGVDDWLPCLECRCNGAEITRALQGDSNFWISGRRAQESQEFSVGGIECCFNCTSTLPEEGHTVDYYLRYEVTWWELADIEDRENDDHVIEAGMLTADISPVVGRAIEYDVYPGVDTIDAKFGTVNELELTLPFNEMFHHEFFEELYHGPDTVTILRCYGHQHIAAIGMWLYNADTGDLICDSLPTYGTEQDVDHDMIIQVGSQDLVPPVVIDATTRVTLKTDYNSTFIHTGVMGMMFLLVDSGHVVKSTEASTSVLTLDVCIPRTCDKALVFGPPIDTNAAAVLAEVELRSGCFDIIAENPMCLFGGICTCEAAGGCEAVQASPFGDIFVKDVCQKTCDTCTKATIDEVLLDLGNAVCYQPTPTCKAWLENILACSQAESIGHKDLDLEVSALLLESGTSVVQLLNNWLRFGGAIDAYEFCDGGGAGLPSAAQRNAPRPYRVMALAWPAFLYCAAFFRV